MVHACHPKNSGEGCGLFCARRTRARARRTRAHVRNVPSSVLPKSTVRKTRVRAARTRTLRKQGEVTYVQVDASTLYLSTGIPCSQFLSPL
jgi:hypothetical protein